MVTIANAVGAGDLGVELDLPAVKRDLDAPYTEYDPSNYHGLYIRVVDEGPLITIYRTGKYIISGCSSLEELERSNQEFLKTLATIDLVAPAADTGFSVQNIVCVGDLERKVDLNALSIGLGLESTEYEPEQFPGLVYRPADFPIVILVFASGKTVLTGGTDLEIVEDAFAQLQSEIAMLHGN